MLANAVLESLPSLGLVQQPTPLSVLPEVAASLGLDLLCVKRDDLLPALGGGTKVRKLDVLLATEPFASAQAWHSVGAIGSGHLVALAAAAHKLGRQLHAHCFWQAPSAHVVANLESVVAQAASLRFYGSRPALALRHPALVFGRTFRGSPVIPPGATLPAAMAGVARAALELRDQLAANDLPQRVYVALGTGGTAVGLAFGLALAGFDTVVHAIAVVERPFCSRRRLGQLTEALRAWLVEHGVDEARACVPCQIVIDRRQLGRGYGVATPAALAACDRLRAHGVPLEVVYSGKAMAALIADAANCKRALFWNTVHSVDLERSASPSPRGDNMSLCPPARGFNESGDWLARLPARLARRLERCGYAARSDAPLRAPLTRRRLLVVGAAGAALSTAGYVRFGRYPATPVWRGEVLAAWEARVVAAVAEAVLWPPPSEAAAYAVAQRVDTYLVGLPAPLLRDIHGMLAACEHATLIDARLPRFTHLDVAARRRYLTALVDSGGLLAQLGRGVRDLCLLGYYQQDAAWAGLAYSGPLMPHAHPKGPARTVWPTYEALRAPPGARPRSHQ